MGWRHRFTLVVCGTLERRPFPLFGLYSLCCTSSNRVRSPRPLFQLFTTAVWTVILSHDFNHLIPVWLNLLTQLQPGYVELLFFWDMPFSCVLGLTCDHMSVVCLRQGFNCKNQNELGRVTHNVDPSIWDLEVGGSLWVHGHPGLHSEFQGSQAYIMRPCIKSNKQENKQTPSQNPASHLHSFPSSIGDIGDTNMIGEKLNSCITFCRFSEFAPLSFRLVSSQG